MKRTYTSAKVVEESLTVYYVTMFRAQTLEYEPEYTKHIIIKK
jgi:hypothetical protein